LPLLGNVGRRSYDQEMGSDLRMSLLRRIGPAALLAVLPAWGAAALERDPGEWTPDAKTISRVDALALKLELPKGFGSISDYSRFYYGTVRNRQKVVEGIFLSPSLRVDFQMNFPGGVHVVPEGTIAGIADGGCAQVNLEFDVQSEKVESRCNYALPVPPPAEQSN
jgi:hypothetical protein